MENKLWLLASGVTACVSSAFVSAGHAESTLYGRRRRTCEFGESAAFVWKGTKTVFTGRETPKTKSSSAVCKLDQSKLDSPTKFGGWPWYCFDISAAVLNNFLFPRGNEPSCPASLLWMSCAKTHMTVSYTHLRAHETDSYLVCRLLLE